jgi:hypothetical protein
MAVNPYARNSQRAPFPGSGARVQNAALGDALTPGSATSTGEIPRVVQPGPNQTQPAGPPVPAAPSSPSSAAASTQSPYAGRAGYDTMAKAYNDYLGRPGSDSEILSHLGGGQWLDQANNRGVNSAIQSLYNSPEAHSFRSRPPVAGPNPADAAVGIGAGAVGTYGSAGGGGSWNENYEWTPGEGGPRVSDLLGKVGDISRLTGFNTAGWGTGERGTESSKNAFGMIVTRFEPSTQGLQQLLADTDFKAFYPNAQIVGEDKIDFGDGMPVDVIRNFDKATGRGDAWTYQTGGGGGAVMTSGGAPMGGGDSPLAGMPMGGDPNSPDFYPKLLAHLLGQLEI